MPIYKSLPRKKKRGLPFYRPIDRAILKLWEMRRSLAPFAGAFLLLLVVYVGLRLYVARYDGRAALLLANGEVAEVVKKYPRSKVAMIARFKLAERALKEGQYDEAIKWLEPVGIGGNPEAVYRISAWHNLALAYLKRGEPGRAIDLLERAVRDPHNAASDYSRRLLAWVYEKEGDTTKAIEIYKSLSEAAEGRGLKEEAKDRLTWLTKDQEKEK